MTQKISIVIPVYNGADYLREAIDSALAQTCSDYEVIVVNDGSNDDGRTEAIAKSYGDKIRYFAKPNGGVASALNLGIKTMRGQWFAWLSHDDLFSTNRVETDLELVRNIPEAKVIFCKTQIVDSAGTVIRDIPCSLDRVTNPREALMLGGVDMCSMTIHRSCFDTVSLFDESYRIGQDTKMSMLLSRRFTYYHNPHAITSRRDHPNRGSYLQTEQLKKDSAALLDFIHREFTLRDFYPNLSDDEKEIASAWRWLGYQYENFGAIRYANECYRAAILARKNRWRRLVGLFEYEIGKVNSPTLNRLMLFGKRLYAAAKKGKAWA